MWLTSGDHRYYLPFGDYLNAEVEWAPDSKAFFMTYSDGGAVGLYRTLVYLFDDNGTHAIEPLYDGEWLVETTCGEPEERNIGAIKWGDDSNTLVVAVEVLPHSNCSEMGTFRAFEITIPGGKIVRSWNQITAKRIFEDSLGVELVNADDSCVRHPESCVPPGLTLPHATYLRN